jgi:hypothetical protein
MGTEMDMAGLFFSAPIYLEYDPIFKVLLIIFGVAFILPLLFTTMLPCIAYCVNPDAGDAAMDDWAKHVQSTAPKEGADRLNSHLSKVNPHGGEMKIYHWFPCLRFYLIVKAQYNATDVDAIFRVNSISSFSLGVFQLIGILATIVNGAEFNLYVKINVATQCLNWFLTFCYFGSPIARYMSVASQARTLSKHFQGILQELANEDGKEVNSVMTGDFEEAGERSEKRKQQKQSLAKLLAERFMGGFDADSPCPSDLGDDAASCSSQPSRGSSSLRSTSDVPITVEGGVSGDPAHVQRMQRISQAGEQDRQNNAMAKQAFLEDMMHMRAVDMKDFLVILRNQIMSVIDVKGGL